MKVNNNLQHRLMGKTVAILSRVLDFRSANHKVIAGNLANIDTPGFRPKDLTFDQVLHRAADKSQIRIQRTNPKHLSNSSPGSEGSFPLVTREIGPFESDQVNIDTEMAKMMKNNLLYEGCKFV